ncbi:unnamed protein product [Prunus armeniaca]|uniref:Uncharacterized protein n=1 Tax=Prunus armeniaca TaxID=36596 RepID=A0A6J5XA36_PRUAR|nr:unnamed protein product [Prunus armeniaca]
MNCWLNFFGLKGETRLAMYRIGAKWADVPEIVTEQQGINHELQALKVAYEEQRLFAEHACAVCRDGMDEERSN